MTRNDRTIVCRDCGRSFVFRADEQLFYADKGYDEPTRCRECRTARKSGFGRPVDRNQRDGAGDGRPPDRQLFTATCAACGKQTQVPFRPKDGRPVYCGDCFKKTPRGR